ncbi:hypothetical protein [uncultured Nostoc sp.]|uniref:hypothetical protein n=1 Tax=uncultured Nostoc sp. TaxID=340711 RepID=UPI0035CA96A8
MYYLSKTKIEGYDLADFVYNYFHNPQAEMSGYLEEVVLFCVDVRSKIHSKEISFSQGYKQVCEMMGSVMGGVLETRLDREEKEFFEGLLNDIPEKATKSHLPHHPL